MKGLERGAIDKAWTLCRMPHPRVANRAKNNVMGNLYDIIRSRVPPAVYLACESLCFQVSIHYEPVTPEIFGHENKPKKSKRTD
eukprot:2667023-Amphidinium_carterae.1